MGHYRSCSPVIECWKEVFEFPIGIPDLVSGRTDADA